MRALKMCVLGVLFALAAVPVMARDTPFINTITPERVHRASGEWFLSISGGNFLPIAGVKVVFSGPAGTFEVSPNSWTDTDIETWIPLAVVGKAGWYSVTVKAGTLVSNAVTFEVMGPTVKLYLPKFLIVEAISREGGYARFDVYAVSQYGESTSIDCSHKSGELMPFGTTKVTCLATDEFGGKDEQSFDVTVGDTTPPAMNIPSSGLIAFGKEGAEVKYEATATDLVDGEVPIECAPQSGSFFRLGTTVVTCTSSDSFKNVGTQTFRVHVGDERTPALVAPERIVAEATSGEGANVEYKPTAVDSRGEPVEVACDPKSGSLFPLGTSLVKCVAGEATEAFEVQVVDTTAPQLVLRDLTTVATGQDGAKVSYDVYAEDTVDGKLGVDCSIPSGSLFAIGRTTVRCSSSDRMKNTGEGSFIVTVLTDNEAPLMQLPENFTVEANKPEGVKVSFTVGLASEEATYSCSPESGSLFPIGRTTVSCTATLGQITEFGSFEVTVVEGQMDAKAPTIVSARALAPTRSGERSSVTFEVMAIDDSGEVAVRIVSVDSADAKVTGPLTIEAGRGTHTVIIEAVDAAGNQATQAVDVTIE